MGLQAVYQSNYIRKEGDHKGKTFHVYTIKGTPAELKTYTSSPQFKKYPRKSATGEPQMHTMYMDALRDELPLYLKPDGNFTLDQADTRKNLSRLEILQESAPAMATAFANRLADTVFGSGKVSNNTANAFIPEPASDGKGAELDENA
jgi:hypothetical protein